MISFENVTISLPSGKPQAKTILRNLTFSLDPGDWVCLTGRNGCGKTTLLQTIAGLLPPASGRIFFSDPSVSCSEDPVEPSIALLLQDPDNQFVTSSVRNELLLSSTRMANRPHDRYGRIEDAIERFELGDLLNRNPHRLSCGEKQRLALASVWLADPDVLLLDEPMPYLDRRSRERCLGFVQMLNDRGVTVIWATPGGEDLMCAKKILWIDGGRLRFYGSKEEFFELIVHEGTSGVVDPPLMEFALRLIAGFCEETECRKILQAKGATMSELAAGRLQVLARWIVESAGWLARELSHSSEETELIRADRAGADSVQKGERILCFEDVSFSYDSSKALDRIDFEIHRGQCVGITGPNGSGKSTLLSLASGVLNPSLGKIHRLYEHPFEAGEQHVFHLFQGPERMFFAETVFEELAFGLKHLRSAEAGLVSSITQALREAELDPEAVLERSPVSLSFGEMQRLAFGVFLSLRPKFLLLDEPSACLDQSGKRILRGIIGRFLEQGWTVMVASHDIDFLLEICDRLIFLEGGCVRAELNISSGAMASCAGWPAESKPLIIEIQDAMASMGVDVSPRAIKSEELLRRVASFSGTPIPPRSGCTDDIG